MPVAYLHGTEFINFNTGVRPIQVVRSSVIGLVGIAPKMPPNQLNLVMSADDVAAYGLEVPGFTIPQSLSAIFANQPSPVLVVNIFDPAIHTAAVALEVVPFDANGKARLAHAPIGALTVIKDSTGVTTIAAVVNVDYTINDFGDMVVIAGGLLDASTSYKISYVKLDLTAINDSDIIGAIDDAKVRTGMFCWQTAYNTYGFKPKQLIAPGFSSSVPVATALQVQANYYKAITWLDAPPATTFDTAIAGRGPAGTINFNFADKRVGLLYPMPTAYDAYSNANQTRWYSAFMAGVVVATDNAFGYWYSPSNKAILGITGAERAISWDITDASGTTDANTLNSVGIITLVNGFGTGNLTWGNSSSAWPGDTTPEQFISVQRTRDVVEESIGLASLPFLDAPIRLPQIDSITESTNQFIRDLISRGALMDGSNCIFDPSQNSEAELALGHIVFTLTMMPPIPGQRITFNSTLDTSLLKGILTPAA